MALTEMKKAYAVARMRGLNQTESAIEAGYSEKAARQTGSNLERDQDVMEYMEQLTSGMPVSMKNDYEDPLDFWRALMNDKSATMKDRKEAARELAKAGPAVKPKGKKAENQEAAEEASTGRFSPAEPPKLKAIR